MAALAWMDRNDYSRARLNWENAINLFRRVGDTGSLLGTLVDFGYDQFSYGDYSGAQKTFDEAILLSQESDFHYYRSRGP